MGPRTPASRSARQRQAWLLLMTGLPRSRSSVSSIATVGRPVPLSTNAFSSGERARLIGLRKDVVRFDRPVIAKRFEAARLPVGLALQADRLGIRRAERE